MYYRGFFRICTFDWNSEFQAVLHRGISDLEITVINKKDLLAPYYSIHQLAFYKAYIRFPIKYLT